MGAPLKGGNRKGNGGGGDSLGELKKGKFRLTFNWNLNNMVMEKHAQIISKDKTMNIYAFQFRL